MRLAQNGFRPGLGQPRPGVGIFDPMFPVPIGSYLVVYIDDAETGDPVPDAIVATVIPTYGFKQTAPGGFEGMAELQFTVPPGPVLAYITAPGYAPVDVLLESGSGRAHGVTVKLKKRSAVAPLLAVTGLIAVGWWLFG